MMQLSLVKHLPEFPASIVLRSSRTVTERSYNNKILPRLSSRGELRFSFLFLQSAHVSV